MQSSIIDGLIDTYIYTNISSRTCRHACEHTHKTHTELCKPAMHLRNLRKALLMLESCYVRHGHLDEGVEPVMAGLFVCHTLVPCCPIPSLPPYLFAASLSLLSLSPCSHSSPSFFFFSPLLMRQGSCRRLGGVCGCDRSQYSRRTDPQAPS